MYLLGQIIGTIGGIFLILMALGLGAVLVVAYVTGIARMAGLWS